MLEITSCDELTTLIMVAIDYSQFNAVTGLIMSVAVRLFTFTQLNFKRNVFYYSVLLAVMALHALFC